MGTATGCGHTVHKAAHKLRRFVSPLQGDFNCKTITIGCEVLTTVQGFIQIKHKVRSRFFASFADEFGEIFFDALFMHELVRVSCGAIFERQLQPFVKIRFGLKGFMQQGRIKGGVFPENSWIRTKVH